MKNVPKLETNRVQHESRKKLDIVNKILFILEAVHVCTYNNTQYSMIENIIIVLV